MVPLKQVCGVPMGGLPGEAPTLLVGSMFFDRQKLVHDASSGEFEEDSAKRLLDLQDHWAEKTGNPPCLDIIASTPRAMRRYLDFVTANFDGPVMIDGSDVSVRIAGIEYMAGQDLAHRVIYNSISSDSTTAECEAIEACHVKAAVVLAVNPSDFSIDGKLNLVEREDGLLAKARECGIEDFLVDPGIIDLPSVGIAKEVIATVRESGCLAGAAPHNALGTWSGLTDKFGSDFKPAATAVLNALPAAWGADFVIYGPVSLAPTVFPAVAMVDAILAQPLLERGNIPDAGHPMFKIA